MAGERAALAATTPQPTTRTSLRAAQAAGENNGDDDGDDDDDDDDEKGRRNQLGDPLIFPGVYAPSGVDMMSILVSLENLVAILSDLDQDPVRSARSRHISIPSRLRDQP